MIFEQDTKCLKNYLKHERKWVKTIKYVCDRSTKDFKNSIFFKNVIHRKKIELANMFTIGS